MGKIKIEKQYINIPYNLIFLSAAVVFILPIFIFVLGWLKPILSVPCVIILLYTVVKCCKDSLLNSKEVLKIKISQMIGLFLCLFILLFFSGIGGYFSQTYDHIARNPIFRDLIDLEWPVIYTQTNAALVYYIGYWLPSALIGKIANLITGNSPLAWKIGNGALFCWSFFCFLIIILLFLIFVISKGVEKSDGSIRKILTTICIFLVCFGGAEIIGWIVSDMLSLSSWISLSSVDMLFDAYNKLLSIDGAFSLLIHVFNQYIPLFIACLLFLLKKDQYDFYAFMVIPLILYTPFGMAGLLCIMGLYTLFRMIYLKKIPLQIFSWKNFLVLFLVLPGILLYYSGHALMGVSFRNIFEEMGSVQAIMAFILLFILEFGLYLFASYKEYKRDVLFWISGLLVTVLIFISIGPKMDFANRAVVAASIIILIYTVTNLVKCMNTGKQSMSYLLIIILIALSSISPGVYLMKRIEVSKQFHTLSVPYDTYYTFRDKSDNNEIWFLKNYIKTNPQQDLFFSSLSNGTRQFDQIRESVVTEAFHEGFTVTGINVNTQSLETVRNQLEGDIGNVLDQVIEPEKNYFIPVSPNTLFVKTPNILNKDNFHLKVDWINEENIYHANPQVILMHLKITNNSNQIIGNSRSRELQFTNKIVIDILNADGTMYSRSAATYIVDQSISPGGDLLITIPVTILDKGKYQLAVDFVQENNFLYSDIYGNYVASYDCNVK